MAAMAPAEDGAPLRTFGDGGVDDVPGRFSATSELTGDVAEVEHLARYAWAASLVAGKRTLDAGCGWAYGTAMFADAGASAAVGLDLAPTVIEVAQKEIGDRVELHVGDVVSMPFEDASFDVVVCFEVIEHLEDRAAAVRELARVLRPDGLLVISSPNRDTSVPGNPYHVHEYTPDELRNELAAVFGSVRLHRQHDWVVSAVMDDETASRGGLSPVDGLTLHKGVTHAPGEELYTIALATNGALPAVGGPHAAATSTVELRRWLELYAGQDEVVRRQHEYVAGLDLERYGDLQQELRKRAAAEAEAAAQVAELQLELKTLRRDLDETNRELAATEERAAHAEEMLDRADKVREAIFSSVSWRVTAPLRRLPH
jgi:SAM-dependent methyltransferase